jgi:hypothetical protein
MWVSESKRYVYIAIPKTGTQSVSSWLMVHYDATLLRPQHDWKVRPEHRRFLIFTVVRNPYERAFSNWWWRTKDPQAEGTDLWGMPFADYVAWDISARCTDPPRNMTQRQYVKGSGATLVLRLERLRSEITRLPFVPDDHPPIPHMRKTVGKPGLSFAGYFSAEDEELVWEGWKEDFEEFGYERLSLKDA